MEGRVAEKIKPQNLGAFCDFAYQVIDWLTERETVFPGNLPQEGSVWVLFKAFGQKSLRRICF
jgi:hypothetical protein